MNEQIRRVREEKKLRDDDDDDVRKPREKRASILPQPSYIF